MKKYMKNKYIMLLCILMDFIYNFFNNKKILRNSKGNLKKEIISPFIFNVPNNFKWINNSNKTQKDYKELPKELFDEDRTQKDYKELPKELYDEDRKWKI